MQKLKLYQLLALTLVLGLAGFLIAPLAGNAKPHKRHHLLFFTLSAGFKHASIPTGESDWFQKLMLNGIEWSMGMLK